MDNTIIINKRQVSAIMINLICTKLFLGLPRLTTQWSGNSAWILTLCSALAYIGIFAITMFFYGRIEKGDLLDHAATLFGRVGKIIVGLLCLFFIISSFGVSIRIFMESIKVSLLPQSPLWFIGLLAIIVITLAAYMGLEALARVHVGVILTIFSSFFLVIAFSLPNFDVYNIFPIFGTGAKSLLLGIPKGIGMFSETMLLFFLVPFVEDIKITRASGYSGVIISGIFILLGILVYCLVVPYPISKTFFLPLYQLSRTANIGKFFSRFEDILQFVWMMSSLLYLSILLFFACTISKKTFDLPLYRPLILPISLIGFNVGFFTQTTIGAVIGNQYFIMMLAWPIGILLPLILAVLVYRKNKKKQKTIQTR